MDDIEEKFHSLQDETEAFIKSKHKKSLLKKLISEVWKTGKQPFLVAILAGLLILILVPILTYVVFASDLTSKADIINKKNSGLVLTDRNDQPFFTFYQARTKKSIPLSEIPLSMQHATIAIEDKDFYKHGSFSLNGIGRAIETNLKEERLAAGGSTITQQLVKNALLTQSKNFLRKYQELVLAIELERRFSKNDILEMYLNTAYFGEGAFGIEDASQAYFGKDASELTIGESALLAGLLQAPSALSPISGDRDAAFERQQLVLKEMQMQGYLTPAEEKAAVTEQITFHPQVTTSDLNTTAPHFALMVKQKLIDTYGEQKVARSGWTVKTTLDLSQQKYAENLVQNQVARLAGDNVSNGAAVALDPKTGEILALVGSHNWTDTTNGKINMATTPRQPGSSFKPIVYAKAFEQRVLTPGSVLDDKPITFPGGYKPLDYDKKFRGQVLVRRALANSLNIPAVLTLQKIGVSSGIEMAQRMGITTLKSPSDYGLSLVLGAAEVPLTEMTDAYAVFADNGTRHPLMSILSITDKKGGIIEKDSPTSQDIIDPAVTFLISSILSDNQARAEEFGNVLTISRPAAVKTGTTENFRDSLTIGYTPSLVVGVWVGNNDNTPMDNIAGSIGAAPIWRGLMEHFLAGTPIEHFIQPLGVSNLLICKDNGLKADIATSSAYMEYFLTGTEPTQKCDIPTLAPSLSPSPTGTTPTPSVTPEISDTPTPTPPLPQDTVEPTPTPIEIHIP